MAWENNDTDGGGIWAIESGASHSAKLARLLAWAALGGQQGVLGATDLLVSPLAVPGTKVRVSPGSCCVLNRAIGCTQESYLAKLLVEQQLDIDPTGAGTGRSDLVVMRVENPYLDGEGWQIPPADQRDSGPFGGARVIPNVPANTTSVAQVDPGSSAITLARVDIPASTGTVTAAMVHDLRSVVNPLTGGVQGPPTGGGDGGTSNPPPTDIPGSGGTNDNLTSTQTDYIQWPYLSWTLDVPAWANYVDYLIVLENVEVRNGDLAGFLRMIFDAVPALEREFRLSWPGGTTRQNLSLTYANQPVPASSRGKKVTVSLQAKVVSGFAGRAVMTTTSKVKATATFKQRPDTT